MFLSLEFPGGDKQISLIARDLAHDEGYKSWMKPLDVDSERCRTDRAVEIANRKLRHLPHRHISMIFNQFTWEGTTGWEYWTKDYDKVLIHALVVAEALNIPLHVHKSFDGELLTAAEIAGVKLEFVPADYAVATLTRHNEQLQLKIEDGQYIRLNNVVLPKDTPCVELF